MSNDGKLKKWRVEQGPCGDSIERVEHHGESGPVECPHCGADVREETIRDGRCEECRYCTELPQEEEE